MSIRIIFSTLMILFFTAAASAAPKIVVTIKPLHSLVSMILGDVGKPELLIDGNTSPHNFSLRPSQAGSISQADLIFWIGPDLETSLGNSFDTLTSRAKVIALAEEDHEDHHKEEHKDEHKDDHKDEHDEKHEDAHHEHGDPHIWLNPSDAVEMLETIEKALSASYPEYAETFIKNHKKHKTKLLALDADLKRDLAAYQSFRFVTFHEAFEHFAEAFKLQSRGSLTLNPSVMPSAKKVRELQNKVKTEGVKCAFAEPQFPPRIVNLLAEGSDVQIGTLDPIGATLEPGVDLYPKLMRQLTANFAKCMAR